MSDSPAQECEKKKSKTKTHFISQTRLKTERLWYNPPLHPSDGMYNEDDISVHSETF